MCLERGLQVDEVPISDYTLPYFTVDLQDTFRRARTPNSIMALELTPLLIHFETQKTPRSTINSRIRCGHDRARIIRAKGIPS